MKPHLLIGLPTDSPVDLPIGLPIGLRTELPSDSSMGLRPERQAVRSTPGVQP
jgi:hypothetical protein